LAKKVLLLIWDYQNDIILSKKYSARWNFLQVIKIDMSNINGKKQRGLSNSKIYIGIACDNTHVFCVIEGTDKTLM